jgi:hypothetical protein
MYYQLLQPHHPPPHQLLNDESESNDDHESNHESLSYEDEEEPQLGLLDIGSEVWLETEFIISEKSIKVLTLIGGSTPILCILYINSVSNQKATA